jgi:hypothetical protein
MHKYVIQQEARKDGQRPWPIAVNEDMTVASGLGSDDGARLIGFQVEGIQSIEVFATEWRVDLSLAVGLEPVFASGGLFVMRGKVVSAEEVTPRG